MRLQILLQIELGLTPFIFSPPHVTLNHLVVTRLLLPSLLHFLLRFGEAALINFKLILQVLQLLHLDLEVFLVGLLVLLDDFLFALQLLVNRYVSRALLRELL